MKITALLIAILLTHTSTTIAQRYTDADGRVRVALLKQPYSPTGTSVGPTTMANGGIQKILTEMGAVIKIEEATLTASETTEYGGWKKLSMIFSRYEKASAIGFATIPSTDEGGLSIAAVNRMIAGAVRGVKIRESRKTNAK